MKMLFLRPFVLTVVALALLPLALSACDSTGDAREAAAEQPQIYIQQSPPQDEVEIAPILDNQTQAWRPGYWAMRGNDHFAWIPGKILVRPSPTAVWTPARWMHHAFGWSFEPGHWQ